MHLTLTNVNIQKKPTKSKSVPKNVAQTNTFGFRDKINLSQTIWLATLVFFLWLLSYRIGGRLLTTHQNERTKKKQHNQLDRVRWLMCLVLWSACHAITLHHQCVLCSIETITMARSQLNVIDEIPSRKWIYIYIFSQVLQIINDDRVHLLLFSKSSVTPYIKSNIFTSTLPLHYIYIIYIYICDTTHIGRNFPKHTTIKMGREITHKSLM